MLGSQGIVVKCTVAIFKGTVNCNQSVICFLLVSGTHLQPEICDVHTLRKGDVLEPEMFPFQFSDRLVN